MPQECLEVSIPQQWGKPSRKIPQLRDVESVWFQEAVFIEREL